jgi:hypothetical protein
MAAIRDFRLVSVSPQLQPFQPSPMDEVCLRAHDTTGAVPGLHAHYVIGQNQDNRRPDTPPNQGREPPLVWSVEFMKKVIHIESNDNSPLGFPWWRAPSLAASERPCCHMRTKFVLMLPRSYSSCSTAIGMLLATTVGAYAQPVAPVPEIDAFSGLAAMSVVGIAALLWERRRRK